MQSKALTLGISFSKYGIDKKSARNIILLFSIMTPSGIVIGWIFTGKIYTYKIYTNFF